MATAAAAKGTLVADVVAAETVAGEALCIKGTFRKGTMEAMNTRVWHMATMTCVGFWGMADITQQKAIVEGGGSYTSR